MNLISEFCEAREQVLDTYAGTFATLKVFLQLSEHRQFVECEKNYACSQDVFSLLLEVYAKQV